MKIKIIQPLKSLTGEPFIDEKGKETQLPLRGICITALMANDQEDGAAKFKRFQLAQKIHQADEVELEAEDIALIKKLIGLRYGPAIVGPAWLALEGSDTA